MPMGKGTYGSQVGKPPKRKNSTDNYAQKQIGTGQNSTDNMNDGAIDRKLFMDTKQGKDELKRLTEQSAAVIDAEKRGKMPKGIKKYAKPMSK